MSQKFEEKYRWKIIIVSQKRHIVWWKEKVFEIAERPPWVRILVISWNNILLNREERHEVKWWYDYRLPWWKVFDILDDYIKFIKKWWDLNKEAQKTAKKELKEETWIKAELNSLKLIHISHCWATIKWDLYYYNLVLDKQTDKIKIETEEWEKIQVWWYSFEKVKQMCLKWYIQEDRSLGVILKFILNN